VSSVTVEKLHFEIPLSLTAGDTITGHIDIVQIRNGLLHVLDYKREARKVKPIELLMVYALALSRLTGLRLYHFQMRGSTIGITSNSVRSTSFTKDRANDVHRALSSFHAIDPIIQMLSQVVDQFPMVIR
jgi:hypothetical protein